MNNLLTTKAKNALQTELTAKGLPLRFLPFLLAQISHETGGFKSNLSLLNNLSGIIFVGQKGAIDSGISQPKKETSKFGKWNYAAYKTIEDWAADYISILAKHKVFDAKNLEEFVNKLKEARYFTAPTEEYFTALKKWTNQLKKIFPDMETVTISGAVIIVIALLFLYFYK